MTEPGHRDTNSTAGARALAYILLVLGGAWILLSGGCTLTFMAMAAGGFGGGANLASIGVFLGIGAVCILPGVGLFFGGWVILRKPKTR